MPILSELKEFLWAFNGQWLTRMSGPFTVPFTLLALFVPSSRLKLLFAVMAIACAAVSSFGVWAVEHRARLKAEEKPRVKKEDWAKLATEFAPE